MNKKNKFLISNVKLDGYKSIENVSVDLKSGLNIIIGKNAVGKTNFLNFLFYTINFNFINFNNFRSSFKLNHKKMIYNFNFSKKTSISSSTDVELKNNSLKLKFDFRDNKKFQPDFTGILSYSNKIDAEFVSEDENECLDKFTKQLLVDNILLNSIFIRHGLPKNYSIIDSPLNIELWNNNLSDEFLTLYNSENESILFKKLLFASITMDLLDEKYFNKKLRNEKSIEKFIKEKKSQYKKEILLDLDFINDLKFLLKEYSPIEDLRVNDSLNIDIDMDSNKITLRNFFLEYFVDNRWYPFDDLSDGTKRIFYIISEIFVLDNDLGSEKDIEKLNVVCIEEPELGIHPYQLFKLMKFLKEKSRLMQIIITTHSPLSLDILERNQLDSIIIASKNKGKTTLKNISDEKIAKANLYMEDLMLSDYWINSDLED